MSSTGWLSLPHSRRQLEKRLLALTLVGLVATAIAIFFAVTPTPVDADAPVYEGMTTAQVLAVLGEPYSVTSYPNGTVRWTYCRDRFGLRYLSVLFSPDGSALDVWV